MAAVVVARSRAWILIGILWFWEEDFGIGGGMAMGALGERRDVGWWVGGLVFICVFSPLLEGFCD